MFAIDFKRLLSIRMIMMIYIGIKTVKMINPDSEVINLKLSFRKI
jgi:hypothetical protein